jgi:hypothetical protein
VVKSFSGGLRIEQIRLPLKGFIKNKNNTIDKKHIFLIVIYFFLKMFFAR